MLSEIKKKVGYFLLRYGAKMVFQTEADRDELKQKINSETWIGSQMDSGGHLCSGITPMNDYDTQSVINVLRSKTPFCTAVCSKREQYYREVWSRG